MVIPSRCRVLCMTFTCSIFSHPWELNSTITSFKSLPEPAKQVWLTYVLSQPLYFPQHIVISVSYLPPRSKALREACLLYSYCLAQCFTHIQIFKGTEMSNFFRIHAEGEAYNEFASPQRDVTLGVSKASWQAHSEQLFYLAFLIAVS